MGNLSFADALLIFGEFDGLPWSCTTWQDITKLDGPPWETPPDASPNSLAPNHPGWTVATARAVKTYMQNLCSKESLRDRIEYAARGFTDNDGVGRRAWYGLVQSGMRVWKLNQIVDEIFKEYKLTPYDALARAKTKTLPMPHKAQVTVVWIPLGFRLFGEAAIDDPPFLSPPVADFIDSLINYTWHRYRQGLEREANLIGKIRSALQAAWTEITKEGSNLQVNILKRYLVSIRKQITLLRRYKDADSVKEVQEMECRLLALLAEVQNDDTKTELRNTLPKVLCGALTKLVSKKDITNISQLIAAALEQVNKGGDMQIRIKPQEGAQVDTAWTEGVKDLWALTDSEEQLWANLGFPNHKLPFFQEFTGPDAVIQTWSEEGEKWLADPNNRREQLRPRRHQLIGIFRMLKHAFEGKPVLLMDGVGIRKTYQVIGFIACLSYYHQYHEKHGSFPGWFGNKRWRGGVGGIPNLPFLIACPVNLHAQWTEELKRSLKWYSFDVLPYTGRLMTRTTWWQTVWTQSEQQPINRIVLAAENAVRDDALSMFVNQARDISTKLKASPTPSACVEQTIYGQQYLGIVFDEAHIRRKRLNRVHTAYHALRKQGLSLVTMTA